MKDYSHLSVDNSEYLERLFTQYQQAPETLPSDWKFFFDGYEFFRKYSKGTSDFEKEIKALKLIEAYRNFGHFNANLDPLGLQKRRRDWLEPSRYGLTEKDLGDVFEAGKLVFGREAKLSEIVAHLEKTYCGTLTVQFEDVTPEIREWVLAEFEQPKKRFEITAQERRTLFEELVKCEGLERFLHTRYVGVKRFSVEGAETFLSVLTRIANDGAVEGVTDIVIGMAHRGRMNTLINFVGWDVKNLLAIFDGKDVAGAPWFTSDVKYHIGCSGDRKTSTGKNIHLSVAFNPSHLEAVNPVVEGIVWAKQRAKGLAGRTAIVPILIHGDAAMIGQGVVTETVQLSLLDGYQTGGTIHLAIDNQVGFTTDPSCARSSKYCTDALKPLQVPIFHVNADDAEACLQAASLAYRFRQQFKKDVGIRLVGYRKYGHNEGDEPMFTQPVMYEKIKVQPSSREAYQARLEKEGVLAAGEGNKIFDAEIARLQAQLDQVRTKAPKVRFDRGSGAWTNFKEVNIEDVSDAGTTSFAEPILVKLGDLVLSPPSQVEILPKLKSVVERRFGQFKEKQLVDWAGAELLAYASLLKEGHNIRLVGQDAQRGTFSHRHSIYHDHKSGKTHNILNEVNPNKAQMYVHNSLLSEFAALGFEYGVSTADPEMLTIWEAQFGDFANGAQIIIDQFIASGEQKWAQMSGLVMLLPHGFEGQGPEHSSARLERFLQLCAQGNMQVCNVTTPSQLFHMIRRQLKRNFRKPLIVMTPKSLLRHPKVISSVSELSKGKFHEALGDMTVKDPKKVKRAIICTGKIYYDLVDKKEEQKTGDQVALLRAEQLYPFPYKALLEDLSRYTALKEIIWCQEEPENMGALFFVRSKMNKLKSELGKKELGLGYIARPERSSPAVGSAYVHKAEQDEILQKAFTI